MAKPTSRNSRRRVAAATLLTALVCFSAACAFAADEGDEQSSPLINMVITDAPIAEVMTMLSEASGVNIIVGQDVKGTIESVNWRNVSIEDALRWLALSNGLHWYKEDNGYIVSSKAVTGSQATSASSGSPAPAAAAPKVAPAVPLTVARPVSSTAGMAAAVPSVPAALASAGQPTVTGSKTAGTATPEAPVVAAAYMSKLSPASPAVPATAVASTSSIRSAASTSTVAPAVPAVVRSVRPRVPSAQSVVNSASAAFRAAGSTAVSGPAVPGRSLTSNKPDVPPAPAVPPTVSVAKPDAISSADVSSAAKPATDVAKAEPQAPSTEAADKSAFAKLPAIADADGAFERDDTGAGSLVASGMEVVGQETVTTMIPLKYANPAEVALMLGGSVSDTGATTTRPQMGRRANRSRQRGYEGLSGGDAPSGASDYWSQNLNLGGGGGGGGGLGRGLGGGGGGGGGRGGGRGGQGGFGGGGRQGGQGGQGGGFRPEGVTDLIAYMPQNALLVAGDPASIDLLRENLALLDQPVKQVEIATKFIQVDVTENDSFGIDWSVSNGSLEFFNLGFAPGEAVNNLVRWSRGKFEATLGVVQNLNKGNIINEPHVTTQNNVEAEISFYTTIPYWSAVVTYNQFGQREVDFEDDEVDVEQTLYVMPRINADDTITMFLNPIMDDQTGVVIGPNGEERPIVATQEVMTQVTVADGETIVLGGMIRKQRSFNTRSTPLLSEIPIIGKLFRSKSDDTQDSELLIFVTPRIMREIPAP